MRDLPVRLSARPAIRAAALGITLAAAGCGDGGGTAPDGNARALGAIVMAARGGVVTGVVPTEDCSYDASTGWHTCPPAGQGGVSRAMTVRYVDAAGNPQRTLDAHTVAQVVRAVITGRTTSSTPTETQQMTVDIVREETITGSNSADRTIVQNGTGGGTETGTLTTPDGEYTVVRVSADTTRDITTHLDAVIPSQRGGPAIAWPSSGITIQNRRTTYTPKSGGAPRVEVQRHTSEWIGGGKARVTIVVDGRTAMCMIVDEVAGGSMPCAP